MLEAASPDLARLIEQARSDRAAFGALYRQFLPAVYAYVLARIGDPKDAEDLVEQVFLEVLEGLAGYRHEGHFTAWLFTIARRRAADFYRRRKPGLPLEQASDLCDPAPDSLGHLSREEDLRTLDGLLQGLAEQDRELLRLRFAAGLTFSGIAAVLNQGESAVKMRYYRLLQQLQARWEQENE